MHLAIVFSCDAVLFDLDGVLVDSATVVERTWRRWAARHGLDPAHVIRTAHGRRTIETVRLVVVTNRVVIVWHWSASASRPS